jgi:nucleoside-diphosphate-sugar epimerase
LQLVKALGLGVDAFVTISTAYTGSNQLGQGNQVDEAIHDDLDFDIDDVIHTLLDGGGADPATIERMTLALMSNFPNTYTLSKCMSEFLVLRERGSVPTVILRPSIVGSSWREPVPGWVDNVSAAGAVFLMGGLGILKVIQGHPTGVADIVPVDMVVSHILASAVAISGQDRLEVLHSATSTIHPMKWRVSIETVVRYWDDHPPAARLRDNTQFIMIPNEQAFQLRRWLEYDLPSMAYERFANVINSDHHKKQASQLKKLSSGAGQVMELFAPFTMNEYFFHTTKMQVFLADTARCNNASY